MLVRCPKCGFEQPQDRFCASCGIDISAYKPKVSIGTRIAANSLFYFFLIAIVISATVTLLHSRLTPRGDSDRESVTEADSANENPNGVVGTNAEVPSSSPSPVAGALPALTPVGQTAAADAGLRGPPGVGGASPPQANLMAAPPAATLVRPSLRLLFVEAQPDFLRDLSTEKIDRSDSDHGVVLGLRKLLSDGRRNNSAKLIEESLHDLPEKDQPMILFKGTRDPKLKEPIGLFFQILPSPGEERTLNLRIEAKRVLPSLPATGGETPIPDSQTITREFIVPAKGSAFITGLLPHRRKPLEYEMELYNSTPFMALLLAERFQEGLSEFIVFFEVSGSPSP